MDNNFDESLGVKAVQIQRALEELRQTEIKTKVRELKSKLPHLGRCPVCTLRIPCKHYTTVGEISKPVEAEMKSSNTTGAFDVTEYLPKLTPESHKRGFSVRYRGHETAYNFDFNRRHTSLPNEKRLKLLETIESYREERLKKEIDKIHFAQMEEEKKKREVEAAEENRKKYLEKQKRKLMEYKEGMAGRVEVLKEMMDSQNQLKKKEEDKRKKYLDEQKAKLIAYNETKKMLSTISKQRISDLEESVINFKTIKIKRTGYSRN